MCVCVLVPDRVNVMSGESLQVKLCIAFGSRMHPYVAIVLYVCNCERGSFLT